MADVATDLVARRCQHQHRDTHRARKVIKRGTAMALKAEAAQRMVGRPIGKVGPRREHLDHAHVTVKIRRHRVAAETLLGRQGYRRPGQPAA